MVRRSPERCEPSPVVVAAWVRLLRAQKTILAAVERDLKAAELPPLAWYDVLLELERAPDRRLRPFEIESRTLLAQYNLSRLLDRLEHQGLVAREPCARDGRGLWIVLTRAGRALRLRMWRVYSGAIRRHVGGKLDEASAQTLADLLDRVIAPTDGGRASQEARDCGPSDRRSGSCSPSST